MTLLLPLLTLLLVGGEVLRQLALAVLLATTPGLPLPLGPPAGSAVTHGAPASTLPTTARAALQTIRHAHSLDRAAHGHDVAERALSWPVVHGDTSQVVAATAPRAEGQPSARPCRAPDSASHPHSSARAHPLGSGRPS